MSVSGGTGDGGAAVPGGVEEELRLLTAATGG